MGTIQPPFPNPHYQDIPVLALVFTGTYQRSLDNKLRVLLPKRLRSSLADDPRLFLTPGTDHCLELHTNKSLQNLAERASDSSADSKNIKSFARLFYARAVECDIDKQGRIRIPAGLAKLAELDNEVVFIGVGSHWELWNNELWDQYLASHQDAFDQITQATFDGPMGDTTVEKDTRTLTRAK